MITDFLHEQVWRRFIYKPFGLVLDYADKDGNTHLPTAEEYKKCIPNPVGWTTPTCDCAFFTGLYLYGLCEKYDYAPSEKLATEIHTLAKGLLLLCDVGEVDGFIARAVAAEDGHSHYPLSSDDQTIPWLMGLWRLVNSPAATPQLKDEILLRIRRTLLGLIRTGWDIPAEPEWSGFVCSRLAKGGSEGQGRRAAMMLFASNIALKLGLITSEEWERILEQKPDNGLYTRPEIISHGFACEMIRHTGLIQFWIYVCAQLCIEQLTEVDPKHCQLYRRGLALNGAAAVPFMDDFQLYNKNKSVPFITDWRIILPYVNSWNTHEEAMLEASRHNKLFAKATNPARANERSPLQGAIFGCWLGIICGDENTARYAHKMLSEAASSLNWDDIGMSYAFAVESALYCRQKRLNNIKK